jgi:hypothetical protein
VSKFPVEQFSGFMNELRIDTKEKGIIPLGRNLIGTQKWVMREMVKGLEEGVHEFVTLKCRQIGVSTFSLAMDLYWLGKHKGLTGMLVTHDEPARDSFRSTLEMYYQGLPDKWKFPSQQHNRNQWVFRNGTKLLYRVAGTRESGGGKLGRSSAPSFLHATECAFWGDAKGFVALRNSLAQTNPDRLYHWESTANGFNEFYHMYQRAKRSAGTKVIFVSWWANEFYRLKRGTPLYNVYWGPHGRHSTEELTYTREIHELYGVDVDDEQWAWYRFWATEQQPDPLMMAQEFPHCEEQAWIATGSNFFSGEKVTALHKRVMMAPEPRYMKLILGDEMRDTRFVECNDAQANFCIWEDPDPDGVYAMGCDPAYGSSEEADSFAIQVIRCYSDKVVQVAQFKDPAMNTRQFAWAIVYLAGAFQPCTFNLEINGPGASVLNEIDNLKRRQNFGSQADQEIMRQVVGKMREFLYKKYDMLSQSPTAKHTVTTYQMKERYYNIYRDYFESDMVIINSSELAEEMKTITREGGAAPRASNKGADDLCVAMALAILVWNDQLRTQLMIKNKTYANVVHQEAARDNTAASVDVAATRIVQNYLQKLGFGADEKYKGIPGVSVRIPKNEGRPL